MICDFPNSSLKDSLKPLTRNSLSAEILSTFFVRIIYVSSYSGLYKEYSYTYVSNEKTNTEVLIPALCLYGTVNGYLPPTYYVSIDLRYLSCIIDMARDLVRAPVELPALFSMSITLWPFYSSLMGLPCIL